MAPFHLNTSSLGVLIPQLKKQYPNRLMVLMISSTKAPRVSLAPNKLTGNLWADLVTYVIQPDGTLKYVFTLETVVGGSGEVGFNASKITGHVTKL
ncbi:bactericidal permeability-increasing protein-like, partial [Saccoglossus kowalevskii]